MSVRAILYLVNCVCEPECKQLCTGVQEFSQGQNARRENFAVSPQIPRAHELSAL